MKAIALLTFLVSLVGSSTAFAAPNLPEHGGASPLAAGPRETAETAETAELAAPKAPLQLRDVSEPSSTPIELKDAAWRRHRAAFYGHVAPLGGPAGLVGVSVELTPTPIVSLELAAGLGGSGPQGALNVWFRMISGTSDALLLGPGGSCGAYRLSHTQVISFEQTEADMDGTPDKFTACWTNLQVAFEHVYSSGLRMRPYFGISKLMNPENGTCHHVHCNGETRSWLPVVGLQLGGAFGG